VFTSHIQSRDWWRLSRIVDHVAEDCGKTRCVHQPTDVDDWASHILLGARPLESDQVQRTGMIDCTRRWCIR